MKEIDIKFWSSQVVRNIGFCMIIGVVMLMTASCKKKCYDCAKLECENYDPKCAQKLEPGDTVIIPGDTVVIKPGDTVIVKPFDPNCHMCRSISDVLSKLSNAPADTALHINLQSGDWVINDADYQKMILIKHLLENNPNFKLIPTSGTRIVPGTKGLLIDPMIMDFFKSLGFSVAGGQNGYYRVKGKDDPNAFINNNHGLSGHWVGTDTLSTSRLTSSGKLVPDTLYLDHTTDARKLDIYNSWSGAIKTFARSGAVPGNEYGFEYVTLEFMDKIINEKYVSLTGPYILGKYYNGNCNDLGNTASMYLLDWPTYAEATKVPNSFSFDDNTAFSGYGRLLAMSFGKIQSSSQGCAVPYTNPSATNIRITFNPSDTNNQSVTQLNNTFAESDYPRIIIDWKTVNDFRRIVANTTITLNGDKVFFMVESSTFNRWSFEFPGGTDSARRKYFVKRLQESGYLDEHKINIENAADLHVVSRSAIEYFNKEPARFFSENGYPAIQDESAGKWGGGQKSYKQPAAGTNRGSWSR